MLSRDSGPFTQPGALFLPAPFSPGDAYSSFKSQFRRDLWEVLSETLFFQLSSFLSIIHLSFSTGIFLSDYRRASLSPTPSFTCCVADAVIGTGDKSLHLGSFYFQKPNFSVASTSRYHYIYLLPFSINLLSAVFIS